MGEIGLINAVLGGYTSRLIPGRIATTGYLKAKRPFGRASLTHTRPGDDTAPASHPPHPCHRRMSASILQGEWSVLTGTEAVFPDDFPGIFPIDDT